MKTNNEMVTGQRTTGMFTAKKLVFSAMAIALATVIATVIKLPSLPNGGSVTLFSMLVVTLVGYWYGPAVGITASVTYGILQFITEPYAIHPIQVLLDYPVAFGALGFSGFFSKSKHGLVKGYIAAVVGRFFFSSVSVKTLTTQPFFRSVFIATSMLAALRSAGAGHPVRALPV